MRRQNQSLYVGIALGAATLTAVAAARADTTEPPQSSDPTTPAHKLFYDARALATEGRYAEACPMFEKSEQLEPGLGTLFNLSDCYEHVGRTATAWRGFREVASKAAEAGQADRQRIAADRAQTLEPRLSKLKVALPPAAADASVEVKREGAVLHDNFLAEPAPIDPGDIVVTVSAPGRRTWRTTVRAAETGVLTVAVPELAEDSALPWTTGPGFRKNLALVAGGMGVLAIGFGSIFALRAISKNSDSKADCDPQNANVCGQRGVDLREEAHFDADVATVAFGLGIVALAGGAYLWFTDARVAPAVAPNAVGLSARGRW